ncbi:MAG: hypothetical protein LBR51_00490 [Bacteroidales bacterium]|jgi:hypothetical protein|nr:hypothetical protein [Bacteroidales bacterium]
MKIKKYVIRLLLFSVAVAGIAGLLQYFVPDYCTPALPYIVLFFFLLTLFVLYIVLRDKRPEQSGNFVSSYILSRIIKFFSCLLFLVIYLWFHPTDKWLFAMAFLVIYFLYSIFEILATRGEK